MGIICPPPVEIELGYLPNIGVTSASLILYFNGKLKKLVRSLDQEKTKKREFFPRLLLPGQVSLAKKCRKKNKEEQLPVELCG